MKSSHTVGVALFIGVFFLLGIVSTTNVALAQNPWDTPQGQACFERWIAYAMARLNAYNGSAEFNGRKPWSINKYGILEGNPQFGPRSVAPPDNFRDYNYNRYWLIWDNYNPNSISGWRVAEWNGAGIEGVASYVLKCIAEAGGTGGTTGGGSAVAIGTLKQVYAPNESIVVEYSGLPGNQQDWITIVQASAPDNIFGQWFYTGGRQSGSLTFNGLPPGEYEVRVYFNWPQGGYSVQSRRRLTVAAGGGGQQQAQYLGCYKDQGDPTGTAGRDLSGFIISNANMTTARCIAECSSRGFSYAGTQYSSYCFCGNSYGASGTADNCNMACAGNASETCGGTWANSVYRVGSTGGGSGGTFGGMEDGIDLRGSDFRNLDLPQARPELCQAECANDSRCVAWTYVKPGRQGPNARCWLKNSVPARIADSCCVSGVKQGGGGGGSQTFSNPGFQGGYRLDWCLHWAQQCGEPAASAWCRAMGYSRATQWNTAYDIGASSPTYVIGDGKVCDQGFCDGFSSITCSY